MKKKIVIGLVSIIGLAFITLYLTSRPTATEDGAFIPSPLALKLATSPTTNFDNTRYENPYTASDISSVVKEIRESTISERGARIDDKRSEAAMEKRKQHGYF